MSAAILKKISESYHSVMVEPTFRFESLTDLKAKSNLKTCLHIDSASLAKSETKNIVLAGKNIFYM